MGRGKRKNLAPFVMVAGGILLIVAAVIFIWNIPAPTRNIDAPPAAVGESSGQEIKRVSLNDAKAAYDAGNAVFVDVRESNFYAESHIPGALSIPLGDLVDRMGDLKPQEWILTYCT